MSELLESSAGGSEGVDGEESGSQFVTFFVGDEGFGFPMAQVAEIIRLPTTVNVPLTPTTLVGLANLRGEILPILDLRLILEMDESNYNDSTRVIVTDVGRPVGLIVDRVSKVISCDESQIEPSDGVKSTTDAHLLTGVIREDDALIQLMDITEIISQEFESVIKALSGSSGSPNTQIELSGSSEGVTDEDDEDGQLVSFSICDQEYAFDLMEVEEIVRVPNDIAQMPCMNEHVLGLIDLRGRLLPLVSLRSMFQLPPAELEEQNRILVVSLNQLQPGVGAHLSVGIIVDDVREVLNITEQYRDKVPAMLSKDGQNNEVSAVCRLDNGKRLVSILSTHELFKSPSISSALAAATEQGGAVTTEQTNNNEPGVEDDTQLVVFKLADQEYGVTIENVQEITRVPEDMNKVPKTAEFIEGMVNLRGTVLPVLDMRVRFELARMEKNDRQRILVLNLNGIQTGFIMDSVVEVLRLNRRHIEEAPNLSENQKRMMGRVVNLREQQRMIQVLEVTELLDQSEREVLEAV